MKNFFAEFKKFILRGNVLDLAVGVIVGGAFTAIVTSLTENFIQPLLNLIFGASNEGWTFGAALSAFLTAILYFIITAFVLFCIIKAVNKLMSVNKKPAAPAAPTTKKCPYCCTEIALEATRCPNCTSELQYVPGKKA